MKRDIKMDDQTYAMADGPSRVVFLKLPNSPEPYALTIKSYQFKHTFSTTCGIFVPTTVVLDGDFAMTRTVADTALQWASESMMKGARVQATLPFTESQTGRALRAALYQRPVCRAAHTDGESRAQRSSGIL